MLRWKLLRKQALPPAPECVSLPSDSAWGHWAALLMNVCLPQTAPTNVAYSDLMLHQSQTLQNAQSSLPALPPQLAGTLSGIISGLNSGVSQAEAVSMTASLTFLLFLAGLRLASSLELPSPDDDGW